VGAGLRCDMVSGGSFKLLARGLIASARGSADVLVGMSGVHSGMVFVAESCTRGLTGSVAGHGAGIE
jgi:hypothetical protein